MAANATGVTAVVRRELRRIASRPLYPMLGLVLPALGAAVLAATFAQGVPRDLPVVVVDGDHSALSRGVSRAVDATPSMRTLPAETPGEGEALIRRGEAYAVVVIAPGFERDVRRGAAPAVVALYNAQSLLPASLIRRDLRSAIGTVSAGIELRLRESRGEPRAVALERLEPVRVDARTLFNQSLDYSAFLMSALLPTLLQIFIVVTVVHAVGVELRDRTAGDWLAAGGGSLSRSLTGKLVPYIVHFSALGLAMLACLFAVARLPMRGSFAVVVVATILFVLAYTGMALLIAVMTANLRFAASVTALYVAPAFAFVGVTFPLASMPASGRAWSLLLPLTHYLDLLVGQATRGATTRDARADLFALLAFAVLSTLISLPRARRVVTDSKYWGRQ